MKVRLMIIIGVISFLLGGCNKIQKNSNQVQLVQRTEEILVESEDLADDYFHIYKERWNQSNRNSLKLQQDIIEYLGRKNYIAVDINNQIDMVNGELVKKFCKNVQNEVNDNITIFSIMESGGFVRYDLNSQNGEIYAICSNMTWDQDAPEAEYINEFQVQSWKYTKNGYFFIEESDMKYDKIVEISKERSKQYTKIAFGAIEEMLREGEWITTAQLMRKTKLSKAIFYRNKDVRRMLEDARYRQQCMLKTNLDSVIEIENLQEKLRKVNLQVIKLKSEKQELSAMNKELQRKIEVMKLQ